MHAAGCSTDCDENQKEAQPVIRANGRTASDHWVLLVFRGASWDDIVKDPLPYLNAQWDDAKCLGSYIEPWKSYEFKPGRPF